MTKSLFSLALLLLLPAAVKGVGADDLIGAAAGTAEAAEQRVEEINAVSGGEDARNGQGAENQASKPMEAPEASSMPGASAVPEVAATPEESTTPEAGGAMEEGGDKENTDGRDIDNFVAFIYSLGPRDPFISPNSPSRLVLEEEGEDITLESLMAFAERLKGDLGQRIRVVGVSIPPAGGEPYALVIYASGKATKGGAAVVEALPPRTITAETGLPVRYPEEETLFISKLAQLVAQSSPVRLKRDSRVGAVIFPIQTIDDRGILVSLPGYDEPILLPVYRDVDPRTESDN